MAIGILTEAAAAVAITMATSHTAGYTYLIPTFSLGFYTVLSIHISIYIYR